MNKIFEKYKNKHTGETAVLIGGGPTIDQFKPIYYIAKSIYAGVNFIGKHKLFDQSLDKYITVDYYFFGDRGRHMMKDFKVKRQKFGACLVDGEPHQLHLSLEEVEEFGAFGMEISNKRPAYFHDDIANNPVYGHTVVMAGLQFLVYTGISKIYLVGMDCSGSHCFNNIPSKELDFKVMLADWDNAKEYLNKKHPEIEIISVNPVGLKGYFKDLYQ